MKYNLPGIYPEITSVLTDLVIGVKSELQENLIGVYLIGSLATGGFDLDSDIDFLVVTDSNLSSQNVVNLQNMHRIIFSQNSYPAKHLEGSYFPITLLKAYESIEKEPLWYIDNGSTTLEKSIHDNNWHLRWILRESSISIYGPSADTLIEPIPLKNLLTEVYCKLDLLESFCAAEFSKPLNYYNSRFGQSFLVLTTCRILNTLSTGAVQSKFVSAEWAKERLDKKWNKLIQQSWDERQGVRFSQKIKQLASKETLNETHQFIKHAISIRDNYSHTD